MSLQTSLKIYRNYFERRIFLSIFICLPAQSAGFRKPNTVQKFKFPKCDIISIPKIYSEKLRKDLIKQIKAEGKLVDSQNVSS